MMGATATVSLSGNAGASDIESHAPEPKNISNNTEREQLQEALAEFQSFIEDIHQRGGFANEENLPHLARALFGPDTMPTNEYVAELLAERTLPKLEKIEALGRYQGNAFPLGGGVMITAKHLANHVMEQEYQRLYSDPTRDVAGRTLENPERNPEHRSLINRTLTSPEMYGRLSVLYGHHASESEKEAKPEPLRIPIIPLDQWGAALKQHLAPTVDIPEFDGALMAAVDAESLPENFAFDSLSGAPWLLPSNNSGESSSPGDREGSLEVAGLLSGYFENTYGVSYLGNKKDVYIIFIVKPESLYKLYDQVSKRYALGDHSPHIAELQSALAHRGYDVGHPDGIYGPQTQAAIEAFQADAFGLEYKKLVNPGVIDQLTEQALRSEQR